MAILPQSQRPPKPPSHWLHIDVDALLALEAANPLSPGLPAIPILPKAPAAVRVPVSPVHTPQPRVGMAKALDADFYRFMQDPLMKLCSDLDKEGLSNPENRHSLRGQNYMFFAAARPRYLGGAETLVRRLEALGVQTDATDALRQTPLFYAAREGNTKCVEFLVERRCNVNHPDMHRQTALFYAVREGHIDTCRALRKLGASFSVKDQHNQTVAAFASSETLAALNGLGIGLPDVHPDPSGKKSAVLVMKPKVAAPAPKPKAKASVATPKTKAKCAPVSKPPAPKSVAAPKRELRSRPQTRSMGPLPSPPESDEDTFIEDLDASDDDMDMVPIIADVSESDSEPRAKKRKEELAKPRPTSQIMIVRDAAEPKLAPLEMAHMGLPQWLETNKPTAAIPRVPVGNEILVQAAAGKGVYFVCKPQVEDVPRLREIEREFVMDHFSLFKHQEWTRLTTVADWCRSVNVILGEEQATRAISTIITGNTNYHITLQLIFVPTLRSEEPSIVGYIHFVHGTSYLDISHLKVVNQHRQRGLGALLLAGMARYAMNLGYEAALAELRLVVMSQNKSAVKLYQSLGFIQRESITKPLRGLTKLFWAKMVRNQGPEEILDTPQRFAERCAARILRW